MDRRYLAATLAIVGTFLVLSHGFRSLEQVVMAHAQRMNAHAMDKWRPGATHLRSNFPEEAQLLAEMNVPMVKMRADLAARKNAALRAREDAMREAERTRHEAAKIREQITCRDNSAPMSFRYTPSPDFEKTVRMETAMVAKQLAKQNLKMQIAMSKLHASAVQVADVEPQVSVVTSVDTDDDAPEALPQPESDDSTPGRPCPRSHKTTHIVVRDRERAHAGQ